MTAVILLYIDIFEHGLTILRKVVSRNKPRDLLCEPTIPTIQGGATTTALCGLGYLRQK